MIDNLAINNPQHQRFNVNINIDLNNGAAATALFVVLGACCCIYINARYNYTTDASYSNNSLCIRPTTIVTKA